MVVSMSQKIQEEKYQESISSFVDDELDFDEREDLISQLHENENHKQVWGRYCVMSDAIKKSLPDTINHNLFERVHAALENEPALLAPAPNHTENELPEAEIIALPIKNKTFKFAYGFGIAASLTLAVVIGFQMNTDSTDMQIQQASVVKQNIPATQQIQIASKPVSNANAKTTVSFTADELKRVVGDATYAEQSLKDDGRWTRITQIDGIPLANRLLSGRTEAHVQYKLQNNNQPLARSVNLDASN